MVAGANARQSPEAIKIDAGGPVPLVLSDTAIRSTHLGPGFVLMESLPDHAPCEAFIWLRVDDSQSQWKVGLPDGNSKSSKRVALASCE